MKSKDFLVSHGVNIDKSLELFGDMDTYNDSLKDFQADIKNKLENIDKYKQSGDMANYAILVHSLKSDSKYFGFDKLAELSLDHELKSKANDMYYVYDHYDELMDEAYKVANMVNDYLETGVTIEVKKEAIVKDKSILVVDDSNVIANFITSIFDDNFNIITAKDGNEALNKLVDPLSNIHIMLLDLNMPNVDGYQVLKYMKEHDLFKNVKVAIVTGNDSKDVFDKITKEAYPVGSIVEKPFNETSLRTAVNKLI